MRQFFIVLSSVIALFSTLPYLHDIIRRQTKPRIVSWFTWALLGAIGGAASLSDHQYSAAVLDFCSAFSCTAICVLGFLHDGEKSIARFDIICQFSACFGLVLWYVFNSPAIAIIAAIGVDLIASLPTLRHSWEHPSEETLSAYTLFGFASILTLITATSFRITAIASPIYILLLNCVIAGTLLYRRKHLVGGHA